MRDRGDDRSAERSARWALQIVDEERAYLRVVGGALGLSDAEVETRIAEALAAR